MPFNNVIARGDVPAREETIDVVMDGLTNESAARKFFREIRVGKNSQRFPVLSALPMAYWVNGDTGLKQTSEMAWTNKFVTIEELAVIVPVPQNVVDDSDFDIWAEARPKVGEAIDRALDAAIFFGINAPASFPTNVTAAALAAGNAAEVGTSTTAEGGFFGDVDAALESENRTLKLGGQWTQAATEAKALDAAALLSLMGGPDKIEMDDEGKATNLDALLASAKQQYPWAFSRTAGADGAAGGGAGGDAGPRAGSMNDFIRGRR
jgi:hypothetical protein